MVSAARVFARDGFHRASLAEIAAGARVTTGAVYSNFKNKDDLFLSVIEHRLEERLNAVRASSANPAASSDQTKALGALMLEFLREDREWTALYLEFILYSARNVERRPMLMARARRTRDLVADMITTQLRTLGATAAIPTPAFALLAVSIFRGLGVEGLIDPESVDEETLVSAVVLLLSTIHADR